jgi:hypothetical protein
VTIRKGLVKRLHVNQQVIRSNRKSGKDLPAVTVQVSSGPIRCKRAVIHGPSVLMQATKPLSCGARVWIETRAEVTTL